MSIGKALKTLRGKAKMTQAEFSDFLGTPIGTYRNWEQDLRDPDTPRLVEIANKLGTTTDYLLGIVDSRNEPDNIRAAANNGLQFDDLSEESQDKIRDFIKFMRSQESQDDDKD